MHDLRFAVRSLVKNPSFTIVVLLTLALGVGATTALFSFVHAALIRSAPFPHSERMVMTPQVLKGTGFQRWYWSYLNYQDVLERATSFEQLEGVHLSTVVLTGRDTPRRMFVRYVTPGFLDLHGASPVLGRSLGPEDNRLPGGHPVVVITYKLWQTYFGGDPTSSGRRCA